MFPAGFSNNPHLRWTVLMVTFTPRSQYTVRKLFPSPRFSSETDPAASKHHQHPGAADLQPPPPGFLSREDFPLVVPQQPTAILNGQTSGKLIVRPYYGRLGIRNRWDNLEEKEEDPVVLPVPVSGANPTSLPEFCNTTSTISQKLIFLTHSQYYSRSITVFTTASH